MAIHATRAYDYGSIVVLAVGAASVRNGSPIVAREVLLHTSTRCFFRIGGSGVVATSANGIPLEAGEKFHVQLSADQYVSVIQDTAAGSLSIVPVV
jgi:hypothetical protein